jgi:hypothetical protein
MSAQPKTPKPANGSADAHREGKDTVGGSDDDDDPEQDLADVPAGGGLGGSGGGGGGGGGFPGTGGGGGGGGISLGLNARTIALGAGLAIAGYIAYKTIIDSGGVTDRTPTSDSADDEDAAGDGGEENVPDVPKDPNDPLKADDAVGDAIFDGWGG